MVSLFSKHEMSSRWEKVQELMIASKLDFLFLTNDENFIYFAGTQGTIALHYSLARPSMLFVPSEGEPIAVVSSSTSGMLKECLQDVRTYNSVFDVPPDALLSVVKDIGLKHRRVGVEYGLEQRLGMPYNDFRNFVNKLERVELVDAASILWKMRMVKSKEEIEYMKRAAEVTGKGRQKTFDQVKEGMTLRRVAQILSANMHLEGADRVSFIHVGTDFTHAPIQMFPETPLKRGDRLYLDAGAYVKAYTIDYPRWATIGKPSSEHVKAHNILTSVDRKMTEGLKPGVKCSGIYKIGFDALKHYGLEPYMVGRMGHGQGMLLTEPPSITSMDDTVLEPGLVVSTEPLYRKGDTRFIWENTHVITEDAQELLTTETEELREIG